MSNVYATVCGGTAVDTRNVDILSDAAVARFVAGVQAPKGGALGGVSLYLTAAAQNDATLPTVTWELWRRFGENDEAAELVTNNTLSTWTTAENWHRRGSIVDVSGGLVSGYELRARVSSVRELRVSLRWVVGLPTGLVRAVTNGSLV